MNANEFEEKKYSCKKTQSQSVFSLHFFLLQIFKDFVAHIFFSPLLLFLEFARNVKQLIKHDDILKHLISDNRRCRVNWIAIEYSCSFLFFARRFVNREDFAQKRTYESRIEWQNGQNEDKRKKRHKKKKTTSKFKLYSECSPCSALGIQSQSIFFLNISITRCSFCLAINMKHSKKIPTSRRPTTEELKMNIYVYVSHLGPCIRFSFLIETMKRSTARKHQVPMHFVYVFNVLNALHV